MANKRMFSKDIVGSDAFQDMPASSQLLYFHLGMEADDDGFIGNPKKIARSIGMAEDDMKILVSKRFVLLFPSGVLVIKHHRINNNWDRCNFKRTMYMEEFSQLYIKENKAYTTDKTQGEPVQTELSLKSVVNQTIDKIRLNKTTKCDFLNKNGKPIELVTADEYEADGFSPADRLKIKKAMERSMGLTKTNKWASLIYGIAWDFKKAFKHYMGYEFIGNVILDEIAKTVLVWYESGETRESLREMILAFFQSEKAKVVTVTPNSVFSGHTYNSWKQGKLKIKEIQKKEWWQ